MPRIALVLAAATSALAVAPLALAASHATKPLTVTIMTTKVGVAGTAHAGKITLRLVNKGTVSSAFRIAGKTSALIPAGKSGTLVVTLKKGLDPYVVTEKGHKSLNGKLKISA